MDWYRRSPYVRFAIRTLVVAAISYVVASLAQGGDFIDWHSLLWGVVGAVCKAALGLLTPEEPFVGVKPSRVEVPSPPAVEEVTP